MYGDVRSCMIQHMSSQSVTVSEARAALPSILDRVSAGDEVTITRHGRAVAVVVRPDSLRARRIGSVLVEAGKVRRLLDHAGASAIPAEGLSPERAEELVADVTDGRARH